MKFLRRENHLKTIKVLRLSVSLSIISLSLTLSACSTIQTVQPWEKGKLARQDMRFDRDNLDARFVDHTYFSKEASSGGSGVGGGGCGCN
ncbi:DUF4266 domain-containing protein [Undibacterium sp. LX40W]|uniref:DUF4266 domain-containing protein n=1 Tax=Undibacterium nitidum TaxID=2762298 RepID=A0A923HLQ7_9BURK|nr:DUF4266 domain-containing protein [Undibacterium nitidum]MBC3890572.1 DUF4266 domain-containing protein [Undibacterium sp. LX40W]